MISRYFYLFGVAQDRFSAAKRGVFNIFGFVFCHRTKHGFFTYAPHVLVVARLPMLLGTRKGTPSITGFIDMMGCVGATATGIATAVFAGMGGWNMAFMFWAVGAFGSEIALVLLWNLEKKNTCSKIYSNARAPSCQFAGYIMVSCVV